MKKFLVSLVIVFLTACSGPNPNSGERTIDMGIEYRKLTENDLKMLTKKAEEGKPWAQLRMGVIYQLGNGVDKNIDTAEYWYTLASKHFDDSRWSNGKLIFTYGQSGYFNQNSDALIAKFQLATIYLDKNNNKYNIEKGYALIKDVYEKTEGKNIFYCCEFAGGRYITAKDIKNLLEKAENLKTEKK